MKAFPKIFAIGTKYVDGIFDDEVEVTEKIDGSQFVFGKDDKGQLFARSKGQQLVLDNPTKMFAKAVEYILSIEDKIADDTWYYSEYLEKPKHNVLAYERVPTNNLILFGVCDSGERFESTHIMEAYADKLGIEAVPVLFQGDVKDMQQVLDMLEGPSVLGNVEREGIVVKNYAKTVLIGGQVMPLMAAKYVSEKFKEVHRKTWSKDHTNKGRWETFMQGYRTEARWEKAVQHLREKGELDWSPRDIGNLMKEVNIDIITEEKDVILEFLWKEFGKELLRVATRGLPEWYKEQLLKSAFEKPKGGEEK